MLLQRVWLLFIMNVHTLMPHILWPHVSVALVERNWHSFPSIGYCLLQYSHTHHCHPAKLFLLCLISIVQLSKLSITRRLSDSEPSRVARSGSSLDTNHSLTYLPSLLWNCVVWWRQKEASLLLSTPTIPFLPECTYMHQKQHFTVTQLWWAS